MRPAVQGFRLHGFYEKQDNNLQDGIGNFGDGKRTKEIWSKVEPDAFSRLKLIGLSIILPE